MGRLLGTTSLIALVLSGCAPQPTPVWVDLNSILRSPSEKPPAAPSLAKVPSGGSPAVTFTLPGRESEIVTGPTFENDAATTEAAEASQAAALKKLRQRLAAVYSRQADFYAEEQLRLLGDPESRALNKFLPNLKQLFGAYAALRMPLVIKLSNLAGFPDSNPKGAPAPDLFSPLAKKLWTEANATRKQIGALDDDYSKSATALLAQVGHLANQERLALLGKVDAYRRQMNERAMSESANPFESGEGLQALHLSSEPAVVLPRLAPQKMTLPAVPPLPPAPKVDLGEAQPSMSQKQLLLGKQLAIWLALNQQVLSRAPGKGIPDETGNFDHWRKEQQAGP
jgi:hypothetical protein